MARSSEKPGQSQPNISLGFLFFRQGAMGYLGLGLGAVGLGSAILLLAASGWFITAAGVAGLSPAALYAFNYLQPAALIRTLAICRTLALYGERIVSHDGILRLLQHLRLTVFDGLSRMTRYRLGGLGSGDLMQRMLADIDLLDQWPLRGLAPWVWAVSLSTVFAGFLFWKSVPLFYVFLFVMLLVFVVMPVTVSCLAMDLARFQTENAGQRRQFLTETLAGLITLRTTGALEPRLNTLKEMDHALETSRLKLHGLGIVSQAAIGLVLSLGLWMMLYFGAGAALSGQISPALLAGICCMMLGLSEVMAPLSQTFQALGFTRGAQQRLAGIFDMPEDGGTITNLAGPPRLELENVTARQGQALTGPDRVSFSLNPGDTLWIQGPSGCGKSTLAAVMAGWLTPLQGSVWINGTAMDTVEEKTLRRQVGLLDQDLYLFPMTLAENLRLAKPDAEDSELLEILEQVALATWARQLPRGLDTPIGEYGTGLSGGQARRVCLARLLLFGPPILILDEPFEGLDTPTADRLLTMLRQHRKDGILVIISHQHLAGAFTCHFQWEQLQNMEKPGKNDLISTC
ncbi:MAG: thiol reductant ABC exporter subunit CydC [Thermodesulfobacteriota bacterium]